LRSLTDGLKAVPFDVPREMIASLIFCGQLTRFDNCHPCSVKFYNAFQAAPRSLLLNIPSAECSAVNNAFTSSVSGNALDPLVVQADIPDPAFIAALNHREATSSR
jgi:hypothetical protein